MKYFLFSFLCSFLFIQMGNAQVTGFAVSNLSLGPNVVTTSCDSVLTIGFSAVNPSTSSANYYDLPYVINGNNFSGFQFQAVVNWGDGSTSNAGGGTSTIGTNISMNPPLSHTYSAAGTYSVVTTVYNPANQTYAIDSVQYTVGSCMAYFYCMIQVDCNNDGTIDSQINAPVPVTLSNSLYTFVDTLQNNLFMVPNVWAGTYTLGIDPAWLNANNYVIGNVIPSPLVTISGGITTTLITLNCSAQTTSLCASGQIYCDANDNGVLDNGETPISNAPLSVNGTVAYTNANGVYNISFPGTINDTFALVLNQNWLTQHGYTILNNNGNNTFLILGTPCNSGVPISTVNIPLSCNGTVSQAFCYSGYVFCDANGNGVMNAGESPLIFAPVLLYNTTATNSSVTVYTDSTGYFSYCGQMSASNYLIATISQSWLIYNGYNPTIGVITLVGSTSSTGNPGYLAVNCGGTTTACADLWTTVTPWIGYYQNSTAYIKLNWGSYGPNAVGAYTLSFTYPAGVSPVLSSVQNSNYTISGNTISWNLNSAASNFTNFDVIQFSVPGGLINGAQHFFTSSISPAGNISDCGTFNNNGSLLQILGNSYDPNDKTGNTAYVGDQFPVGYLDAFYTDDINYTIRFQNTGTAPAQNIYIIDTLSTLLDWSSFTLLEASHPVQVVHLGNGIFRFEFNQIWLADSTSNEAASHGHLTYRITELQTNALFSEIENTAHIYFDWNAPIVTNTTYHQNMWIDGIEEPQAQTLKMWPNPCSDLINIDIALPSVYQITDAQGRIVQNGQAMPGTTISVALLDKGFYSICIEGKQASFIKM